MHRSVSVSSPSAQATTYQKLLARRTQRAPGDAQRLKMKLRPPLDRRSTSTSRIGRSPDVQPSFRPPRARSSSTTGSMSRAPSTATSMLAGELRASLLALESSTPFLTTVERGSSQPSAFASSPEPEASVCSPSPDPPATTPSESATAPRGTASTSPSLRLQSASPFSTCMHYTSNPQPNCSATTHPAQSHAHTHAPVPSSPTSCPFPTQPLHLPHSHGVSCGFTNALPTTTTTTTTTPAATATAAAVAPASSPSTTAPATALLSSTLSSTHPHRPHLHPHAHSSAYPTGLASASEGEATTSAARISAALRSAAACMAASAIAQHDESSTPDNRRGGATASRMGSGGREDGRDALTAAAEVEGVGEGDGSGSGGGVTDGWIGRAVATGHSPAQRMLRSGERHGVDGDDDAGTGDACGVVGVRGVGGGYVGRVSRGGCSPSTRSATPVTHTHVRLSTPTPSACRTPPTLTSSPRMREGVVGGDPCDVDDNARVRLHHARGALSEADGAPVATVHVKGVGIGFAKGANGVPARLHLDTSTATTASTASTAPQPSTAHSSEGAGGTAFGDGDGEGGSFVQWVLPLQHRVPHAPDTAQLHSHSHIFYHAHTYTTAARSKLAATSDPAVEGDDEFSACTSATHTPATCVPPRTASTTVTSGTDIVAGDATGVAVSACRTGEERGRSSPPPRPYVPHLHSPSGTVGGGGKAARLRGAPEGPSAAHHAGAPRLRRPVGHGCPTAPCGAAVRLALYADDEEYAAHFNPSPTEPAGGVSKLQGRGTGVTAGADPFTAAAPTSSLWVGSRGFGSACAPTHASPHSHHHSYAHSHRGRHTSGAGAVGVGLSRSAVGTVQIDSSDERVCRGGGLRSPQSHGVGEVEGEGAGDMLCLSGREGRTAYTADAFAAACEGDGDPHAHHLHQPTPHPSGGASTYTLPHHSQLILPRHVRHQRAPVPACGHSSAEIGFGAQGGGVGAVEIDPSQEDSHPALAQRRSSSARAAAADRFVAAAAAHVSGQPFETPLLPGAGLASQREADGYATTTATTTAAPTTASVDAHAAPMTAPMYIPSFAAPAARLTEALPKHTGVSVPTPARSLLRTRRRPIGEVAVEGNVVGDTPTALASTSALQRPQSVHMSDFVTPILTRTFAGSHWSYGASREAIGSGDVARNLRAPHGRVGATATAATRVEHCVVDDSVDGLCSPGANTVTAIEPAAHRDARACGGALGCGAENVRQWVEHKARVGGSAKMAPGARWVVDDAVCDDEMSDGEENPHPSKSTNIPRWGFVAGVAEKRGVEAHYCGSSTPVLTWGNSARRPLGEVAVNM